MTRLLALVIVVLTLPSLAVAERNVPPRFDELLEAHVKNNLAANSIQHVGRGEAITTAMVYVTVTRNKVLLYGHALARLQAGLFTRKHIHQCRRSRCVPRIRDGVANARASLAHRLGAVPRVLVFVEANASYATLLTVLRSISEAGAALSLRLAARDSRGKLVGLPVLVWPNRRLVIDHAGRPALIRIEVHGVGGVITATKTYSSGPQRAHNARDMIDVLARLKLASGRRVAFVSGDAHTLAGHAITVIARARTFLPSIILTRPGEGVYAPR